MLKGPLSALDPAQQHLHNYSPLSATVEAPSYVTTDTFEEYYHDNMSYYEEIKISILKNTRKANNTNVSVYWVEQTAHMYEYVVCVLCVFTRVAESKSLKVGKSLKIGKNRIKSEKSEFIFY